MIAGSMVALVTPFDAQGRLDWDSLAKLVDFHLQEGTNAIVAVGTTGESATLDVEEHIQVIRRVVDQVKGRIPVIAGTGANSTREAVALTEAAKSGGADACLLVTPYYNKPTQEGMYQHFRHIAEAVAIPQILYNVPGRTSCDMLPETVERLSKVPNIIGIKEATGDLQRAKEVIERVGKDFLVYSGDDATAVELMLLGGKGNISVTANVSIAAITGSCMRCCASMPRAKWRWIRWPSSWASTAAYSPSVWALSSSPPLTPITPPGAAKALICASRMRMKASRWSCRSLVSASR